MQNYRRKTFPMLNARASCVKHPCLAWTWPLAAEIDTKQCVFFTMTTKPQHLQNKAEVWACSMNDKLISKMTSTATVTQPVLVSLLLFIQKTTDFILLSYTPFITRRSSYVWDFTTKVQGFPVMEELDCTTAHSWYSVMLIWSTFKTILLSLSVKKRTV